MKHWIWNSGLMISLANAVLTGVAADEPKPSADFLVFLADMEEIDGQLMDPMSLEEMTLSEQQRTDDPELSIPEKPEEESSNHE